MTFAYERSCSFLSFRALTGSSSGAALSCRAAMIQIICLHIIMVQ